MMRALAWKEFREHQLVWVAMLALSLGAVLGAPWALSVDGYQNLQRDDFRLVQAMAFLAVGGYGLVCGAMMFAGEREEGTLAFLDSLTGRRRGVWGVKFFVGLLFVMVFGLLSGTSAALAGLETHFWTRWSWLVALPAIAVDSFCWGLLGSALARSTISAVFLTAVAAACSWMPTALAVLEPEMRLVAIVIRAVFTMGVLALSLIGFTRQDLQRGGISALVSRKASDRRGSTRVLLWLVNRQLRWELVALLPVAVISGWLISAEPFGVWAASTLLLGVLGGTGVFAGEQRGGYERFLGDQRLPIGRVWRVKFIATLSSVVLMVVLIGLIGLGAQLLESWRREIRSNEQPYATLLGQAWTSGTLWTWLVVWLAHGFAAGLFFGMLFRKGLVAVVLAVLFAALQVAIWTPSLLAGGLSWWTVLVPPLCLVVATRLTIWAWVTDTISARRSVLTALACVLAAFAWQFGWLGWRAVEVPALGEPFDLEAYKAEVAHAGQSPARDILLDAGSMLMDWDQTVGKELAKKPHFKPPDGAILVTGKEPYYTSFPMAAKLLENPEIWPDEPVTHGMWLDRLFEGEWVGRLEQGLAHRLALLEYPAVHLGNFSNYQQAGVSGLYSAGQLLLARSLQLQQRGEYDRALKLIEQALTLSRQRRSHATIGTMGHGGSLEVLALYTLELWAQKVGPKRDAIGKAARIVEEHVRECAPTSQGLKMDYLLLRARLDHPEVMFIHTGGLPWESILRQTTLRAQFHMIAASHHIPWERERARRILDMLFHGYLKADQSPYAGFPRHVASRGDRLARVRYMLAEWQSPPHGMGLDSFLQVYGRSWLWQLPSRMPNYRISGLLLESRRAATRLKLALWLHQLDEGQFPETLDALVPKYLQAHPRDPFEHGVPSYRISTGEPLKLARRVFVDSTPEHPVLPTESGDAILQFANAVRVSDFAGYLHHNRYVDAIHFGSFIPIERTGLAESDAGPAAIRVDQMASWRPISLLYHVPKLKVKPPD